MGERYNEMKALAQKGAEYETLKSQYIECEAELRQTTEKYHGLNEDSISKENRLNALGTELEALKEEKKKLEAICIKAEETKRESLFLQKRYEEIEKFQVSLKAFVIKL